LTAEHVTSLATSSSLIASGWNTGTIRVYDTIENTDKVHSLLQGNSSLAEPRVVLAGHKTPVQALTLLGADLLASGGTNGAVVLWDLVAETGLFRLLGHSGAISALSFFTSRYLVSTSLDGLVKVWDLEGQCCTQTIASHNGQVWSATMLFSGSQLEEEEERWRLLTGSVNGQVRVWKVTNPKRQLQSLAVVEGQMEDVHKDDVCHYMGTLLRPPNVASSQERIAALHTHRGRWVGVLHHNSKSIDIFKLRSSHETQRKRQRRLRRRREKLGKESEEEGQEAGRKRGLLDDEEAERDAEEEADPLDQSLEVEAVKATDEFEYLGAVRASHKIRDFSLCGSGNTIKIVCGLSTNALEVYGLAKSDKKTDMKVVVFEKMSTLDMYGHATGIRSIALSSDDVLACTVSKNTTKIWNTARRSCIQSLTPTVSTTNCYGLCAAFLPGNTHIILGTREGHLLILDIALGDVVFIEEHAHDGAIWSLDIRRPMQNANIEQIISVVTGSADKSVKFWDVEQQEDEENQPMVVHTRTLQMSDDVVAVRYSHSPGKRLVFVSTLDSTIKVFFDDSLKFFLSLYGHKLPALAVDASDDDALLASSGADKTVKIWGLDFGDTHRTLYGHADSVTDLKFVRRTHNFFTTSKDGTVRYWDGDRFQQILLLNGHSAEVNCLAICHTGAFVLSGGMDRQVRVWERTKDIVFIEEERERELEQKFDSVDASRIEEATSGILNRKRADEEDDDRQDGDDVPQSEAAVKRSILSVASGDRIMEALEHADQELKEIAAFKKSEAGRDGKQRSPNPLLLNMEPTLYILWVLRSVKSAELEQSLLVLSMRHMERLIYYLVALLRSGRGIELCVRAAIFLVTAHQRQVLNQSLALPCSR
jgi:U3 small nucleolar RNA-associated protein 12